MNRSDTAKILASLYLCLAELEMTSLVLYESGYTNVSGDIDATKRLLYESVVTLTLEMKHEKENER